MKSFNEGLIKEIIVILKFLPVKDKGDCKMEPNEGRDEGKDRLGIVILLKECHEDGLSDTELSDDISRLADPVVVISFRFLFLVMHDVPIISSVEQSSLCVKLL
jgi:hypothetical protein